MKSKPSRSAGIKDIAEALGISIGTVDRALHGRAGVNPTTSAKVLKMAEKLNYKPNTAARSLKLNRTLRIAVQLPEQVSSFFDPLRAGIQAAATEVRGVQVHLEMQSYPRIGDGDIELIEQSLKREYDALILTPGNPQRLDPYLRRMGDRGRHVICVASDAPSTSRLASVAIDAGVSGGIAAELLAMKLTAPGAIAVMTGDLTTQDHAEKLRGFAGTLALMAPHLHLLPIVESHESTRQAHRAALRLLQANPDLAGLYINTANSLPVLRALEELGMLGKIQVVTTDLFPQLVPYIESRAVLATLHQRPFTQGKMAFEALMRFLLDGVQPAPITRLAPHIVMRSNLSLFSINAV